MFADYSARLSRENWGDHVTQNGDYINALAQGLAALRDQVAAQGNRISLPHETLPTPGPNSAPGVTMLGQELSLLLGKNVPLTQRAPVTIDLTQPDDATAPALQVNAFKNSGAPVGTDSKAIDTTGYIYENGKRVTGGGRNVPIGGIVFWSGTAASIPAGWALMDGVANAAGTGLNLLNYFVKCGNVYGTAGTTQTGSATTGITVAIGGSTGSTAPGGSCSGSCSGSCTGTTDAGGSGNTGTADTNACTVVAAATGITINAAAGNTGDASPGLTGNTDAASPTGTVSGTIASATTGITIIDHPPHSHQINGGTTNTADHVSPTITVFTSLPASTATNTTSLTHPVSDPGHTHSMSGVSVTLSGHSHGLTGVTVAAHHHDLGAHTHAITDPTHTHTVTANSHHHSIPSHTHTFTGTSSGSTTGSVSVNSHSHAGSSLTATPTDSGHTHSSGEPDSVTLLPIERIT